MNKPMIIDGARTPFMRSGNKFANCMAHDLGRFAINGLMAKTTVDPAQIQHVCMGTVIADPNTSNVAREIVLESSLPKTIASHTVTMACISSNMASTTIVDMIRSGQIQCGIAGGVETFSDVPIRFSKELRRLLIQTKWKKKLRDRFNLWKDFRLAHLKPDIPSPKEFSTGFSMGEAGDQVAARFHVSRREADELALLSHKRADEAWRAGHYNDQVVPVGLPPDFKPMTADDGPRPDTTPSKLAKLSPAFGKFGINTAANSSFFTDGSSAVLLGSQQFCDDNQLKPLAMIKDYFYAGGDPASELLLGPALTVPHLLKRNGLAITDIDVWEVHEAFAGQVLANIRAMASAQFAQNRLGLSSAMGEIPVDKMNLWGGSLSLGHPFGATGARLILTAAQRLQVEDKTWAVVTGCAASGLGSAILLKRE